MQLNAKKLLNKKTIIFIILFSLSTLALTNHLKAYADSTTVAPAGTYSDVVLSGSDLDSISSDVTINNVPNLNTSKAGYFWSHEFNFVSEPKSGGAYIGVQGIGKAVFSIFDWPSTQASSLCNVYQSGFDGGTYTFGGTSCIINYTLTQGDTYQVTVDKIGQNSVGNEWQGSVTDLTTGAKTIIATVNVPTSWGDISGDNSGVWTEYFPANTTPLSSCASLPLSNVTFSNFTGTFGLDTYSIVSHSDSIAQNACTNYSSITDNGNDSFNQVMGQLNTAPTAATSPATTNSNPAPNDQTPTLIDPNQTTNTPTSTATCTAGSFFGLPSWYKYLPESKTNGQCQPQFTSISDVWLILAAVIEILLRVAAIIAVGLIIYAGIEYATSSGDPKHTESALNTIIYAAIGLVITVLSAVLVTFIADTFK